MSFVKPWLKRGLHHTVWIEHWLNESSKLPLEAMAATRHSLVREYWSNVFS
ncbi:MAG: hypothetical protein K0U74_04575 [Alphaproteobacteria bacterium]|nr:hypothetical protein [Alphaproteobacteria bacterium]